jgi:hypothetical protein
MNTAWIGVLGGLAGVLLGSGLSEFLRRSNRIESYAALIFEKRMQIYEQLFSKVVEARTAAEEVMELGKHPAEERHAMVSAVVLDLATCLRPKRPLFKRGVDSALCRRINGAEEVADVKSPKERDDAAGHVRENLSDALSMIKAESGISRINRFFGNLTRSKLSSPMIDYYRKLSKERGGQNPFMK